MALTFKIFPSIGIARLGNSTTEYFVGPEIPGTVIVPDGGYRDSLQRVKRQAARFRIFAWDNRTGTFMGEITTSVADITWTVELANTKAAFNSFHGIGHTNGPLRNLAVPDRESLKIKPGPRTLSSSGTETLQSFDTGTFLGNTVPLGEMRIEAGGQLLVLGGYGSSGSPSNAPLTTFANNDGWHDDVSDGPVTAMVTMHGMKAVAATPAWVICPPTRFAHPIPHMISLYDDLLQVAVDKLGYSVAPPFSFTKDVYPILRNQMMMQWVSSKVPNSYYSALQAALSPTASDSQRDAVFQQLRPPSTLPTAPTSHDWPAIWSDYFADTKPGWVNQPFTATQYQIMQAWRDSPNNFINDWTGPPSPDSSRTPDGMTRAALENCSGAPFFPGIETSFMTRDQYLYAEPFRLDWTQGLVAGDLTRQNAVPWQADFLDCEFESPLSWWPSARPDDVITASSKNYVAWERGLKTGMDMVNFWSELGFIVQGPNNTFVESQRILP
jgi:hypothetical protein